MTLLHHAPCPSLALRLEMSHPHVEPAERLNAIHEVYQAARCGRLQETDSLKMQWHEEALYLVLNASYGQKRYVVIRPDRTVRQLWGVHRVRAYIVSEHDDLTNRTLTYGIDDAPRDRAVRRLLFDSQARPA